MKNPRLFLNKKEQAALSAKIDRFEAATGCELVFNFRKKLGPDPLKQAQSLFYHFKLDKTEHHAAILIVLALQERAFGVWADEKVHRQAGDHLWTEVGEKISHNLRHGKRLEALFDAIDVAQKTLETEQSEEQKHSIKTISNKPLIEDGEDDEN